METSISALERTPRIVLALAAGGAAALARSVMLKGLLLGSAAAMLATVATGYCPLNAALKDSDVEAPHWRTLKTHRVAP